MPTPKSGYSDGELHRLVTAARSDVVAMRNRHARANELIERFRFNPSQLTEEELAQATQLVNITVTGKAPPATVKARCEIMSQQYILVSDLTPLLLLMVAVTGLNIETVKELPAAHRVLEDRVVEIEIVKRRRGSGSWHETVTWEIGSPGREHHAPGGLYLLLHGLMKVGRVHSGTESLWSVWRRTSKGRTGRRLAPHVAPFAERLDAWFGLNRQWTQSHQLIADRHAAVSQDEGMSDDVAKELNLDFNRLKTSIDVRTTKSLGGHLPSAARTNTVPVLYRNYLRNDPHATEWAHGIVAEALVDAEQVANRAANNATGAVQGTEFSGTVVVERDSPQDREEGSGRDQSDVEGAWTACSDPSRNPSSQQQCTASFLDCFSCANSVVGSQHLPQLISLVDVLADRRTMLPLDTWTHRYGTAWDAIHRDILPKFAPAEVSRAQGLTAKSSLDLVEEPWEVP
ncbi:hypothetical protein ACWFRB_01930 [Rhodococcus sp. NPDC055112]